jgi:hypothetical protein
MSESDIHTCSYQCHRPECIKAQRDELRNRFTTLETENAQLRAELAALREHEPVAWIVEHDDYPTEVELINELDHAPEIIGQEEAKGWRFTPLYAAPQPAIPEGFVLVPVEPTDEMIDAGADAINFYRVDVMRAYTAMVLAAQQETGK